MHPDREMRLTSITIVNFSANTQLSGVPADYDLIVSTV